MLTLYVTVVFTTCCGSWILPSQGTMQTKGTVYLTYNPQDPAISNQQPSGQYPPFDDGLHSNLFVTTSSGQLLVGKVMCSLQFVFIFRAILI